MSSKVAMHVGVDAACWLNKRGYGRHARSLLGAVLEVDTANRYTLLFDTRELPKELPPGAEGRIVHARRPAAEAASAESSRSLPDLWRMSRALADPDFDVLLFPSVYTYVPVRSPARKVIFIHDVIAERFPQWTHPRLSSRVLWKAKVALALRQADAIVTVSDYSRDGLLDSYRLSPQRVFVVPEAPDPIFRQLPAPRLTERLERAGLRPDSPYVAYVGGFGPHKNVDTLLEAYASATARAIDPGLQLVMVGEHEREVFHSEAPVLRQRVESLGLSQKVIFTGYLPDEDLVVLLNLARALVLPSWMEGFGLPAVEAAACGCPVIATRESPLPKLLGEGGIYIDPGNLAELRDALRLVLSSCGSEKEVSVAGIAAVEKLRWSTIAAQMIQVIERVQAS